MKIIDLALRRFGYVKAITITRQLNFSRSIGKRLDEHREEVESIFAETDYFESGRWRVHHMATQDDFLMRLYFMVHRSWPDDSSVNQVNGEYVRARPAILGPCQLPEYPKKAVV